MKKLLFGILMLLMLVSFCGCVKVDNTKCSQKEGFCSNHLQLDKYVFENGQSVTLRLIIDPGTVFKGQTGTLYKYTYNNSENYHAWFQWVRDEAVPIKPITIPIASKPSALNINIVDNDKSVWINSSEDNPKRYIPVLIKFKNDTISVGYINNINEWKLSINRRQKDGGETIPKNEIIFWKSVDIQ